MTGRADDRRTVLLFSQENKCLFHFHTDRESFPPFVTWGRDRFFTLEFTGNLASFAGDVAEGLRLNGAVYREAEDIWRIAMASIDKPKPRRRWRKRPAESAVILQFPTKAPEPQGDGPEAA